MLGARRTGVRPRVAPGGSGALLPFAAPGGPALARAMGIRSLRRGLRTPDGHRAGGTAGPPKPSYSPGINRAAPNLLAFDGAPTEFVDPFGLACKLKRPLTAEDLGLDGLDVEVQGTVTRKGDKAS